MQRPVKSKPCLKAGRFAASENKYKPNLLCKANMPPLIHSPAPSHMSSFRGPLATTECKITFNTPFLESYDGTRMKKKVQEFAAADQFRMDFLKKETLCFVSGLNQRLTEICLDGSKTVLNGKHVTSEVAKVL